MRKREPWRFACPEDHRVVSRVLYSDTSPLADPDPHWYCETCSQSYDRITDLKHNVEVSPGAV